MPAEHTTSRIAIGRSGSVPSHSSIVSSWMVTSRSARTTVSPARAMAYARRPPTLIALNAGGRCEIAPVKPASAASTASRVGAVPVEGTSSPSRSSVEDEAPKQTVAR